MITVNLSKLAQSINDFEDVHKEHGLFEDDGSLTHDGWNWLHDAEENWADDIKWNDYTKFHLRSRISQYWYGEGEPEDVEYYEAWCELHEVIN